MILVFLRPPIGAGWRSPMVLINELMASKIRLGLRPLGPLGAKKFPKEITFLGESLENFRSSSDSLRNSLLNKF